MKTNPYLPLNELTHFRVQFGRDLDRFFSYGYDDSCTPTLTVSATRQVEILYDFDLTTCYNLGIVYEVQVLTGIL